MRRIVQVHAIIAITQTSVVGNCIAVRMVDFNAVRLAGGARGGSLIVRACVVGYRVVVAMDVYPEAIVGAGVIVNGVLASNNAYAIVVGVVRAVVVSYVAVRHLVKVDAMAGTCIMQGAIQDLEVHV
jgi:hypothetical protein